MADSLGICIENFLQWHIQRYGRPSEGVQLEGMTAPSVHAPCGSFGIWEPKETRCSTSIEVLEQREGHPIHPDLYYYCYRWRFAALEFFYGDAGMERRVSMLPVYDREDRSFFFTEFALQGESSYWIGTSEEQGDRGASLFFKNKDGSIFLLYDDDGTMEKLAESIGEMLEKAWWPPCQK